ncbi:MAG: hypothetical protein ACYDAG_06295 [Chloroflexota bacterium]
MTRRPGLLVVLCAVFLASCGQVLLPPSNQGRQFGPTTSSASLNPPLLATPTPPDQRFPGLTPLALGTPSPVPTPNPIVTPYSYVKEHAYADLLHNGQQYLIIIAGDRRPSPPASPTPVLQNQKGEYAGNFTYNLQLWHWNPTTNQYSLAASWPNNPAKRYVDMRYTLADLQGNGTQQIMVQARVEGVAQALDYQVLSFANGKLQPIFGQSGLEHGQVRIIGQNIWQEQSVRSPNEDPCCPSLYRDSAFIWNGSRFAPTNTFIFPTFANFPQPTPTPLGLQATPVPLGSVSVPVPAR